MRTLITGFLLVISFNSFSQPTIFATLSSGDLYTFDLTNCTKQIIGSTGQTLLDISFTPDGSLWGIAAEQLYKIDPITANSTLIGNTGINAVSLVELNDTTLLAEFGLKLYSINTNTAISSYIDTIGYKAEGDLTWLDDDLYMVTSKEKIIKITLNNNNTAIQSVTLIGKVVPQCEAAVTSPFVGDYNSIVGFNGTDAIKICQIDGSYKLLCSNLNDQGVFGGASMRLPTQIPQPIFCSTTGVQNNVEENLISLYPNPVTSEINITSNYKQILNYNIYNSIGQMVKTGMLDINSTTISISDLSNGIYNIECFKDNKIERKRFVVQK